MTEQILSQLERIAVLAQNILDTPLPSETFQVGLQITDGKLYAGNGKVVLGSDGLKLTGDLAKNIRFYHADGRVDNYAGALYATWDGTGTGDNTVTLTAVDDTDPWANSCVQLVATQGATLAEIKLYGNAQIYYTASLHSFSGSLVHTGASLGFYNHAASTQQVLPTGAGKTVDEVITALQNLGLVKQS